MKNSFKSFPINKLTYFLCLLLYTSIVVQAQTDIYVIGPDDVISISFWQDPELNTTTKVNKDGTISLPVGGVLPAAGLTTQELADAIIEQVSVFNRRITRVNITITEYGSQKVYVMGNVTTPGKYTFEVIPNLWDVISEAGGPTLNANLDNVMIIRNKGDEKIIINVDLATYLRTKQFKAIPKIEPGDNIYIPAVVGNVPTSGIQAAQSEQNVVFVYGQVGNPGVYTFNKELNLLEALIIAGGPTPAAKLEEVKVIRKTGVYSSVIRVDVDRYAHENVPGFFKVYGGDTIYVPRRRFIRESIFWNFFMIASTSAITALVYDFLRDR